MRTSLKRPWQRILAMVLCMAMVQSFVPVSVQAAQLHTNTKMMKRRLTCKEPKQNLICQDFSITGARSRGFPYPAALS